MFWGWWGEGVKLGNVYVDGNIFGMVNFSLLDL